MTLEEFEPLDAIEARQLLRYRRLAELLQGGYEPLDAFVLATDPSIDVRQAVDLLASGCPRATLFSILL